MNSRPRIKSHAKPIRRSPGSIQLGSCQDAGVVLDGLSDAEIAMAERLDGSMDIETLYAVAGAAGVAATRMSELIATLDENHLLVDITSDLARVSPIAAPMRDLLRPDAAAVASAYGLPGDGHDYVAARATRHVLIGGEGDLPCALADLLRVGGIGQVSVGTNAVNVMDLELRSHRGGRAHATFASAGDPPASPDLVVLAAVGAIHPDAGEPWLRRGIPHLPLVVQGHRVQIGPLITNGAESSGPCLSCMDLHRRDRDPAWPAVLSQLAPGWPSLPGAPVNLESTLTAMTIGAAAMIVHACLDGQPVPDDVSLELSLPWPTINGRRWFTHPVCGCAPGHERMAG